MCIYVRTCGATAVIDRMKRVAAGRGRSSVVAVDLLMSLVRIATRKQAIKERTAVRYTRL